MKRKIKSILLIEDDEVGAMASKIQLESAGHRVFVADGIETTKKILDNGADAITMAFVDLDLQRRLEGLEIIPLLKKYEIHIVMLSQHNESDIVKKAFDLGANEYLLKPFRTNLIKEVIEKFQLNGAREKAFDKEIYSKITTQNEKYKSTLAKLRDTALYSKQDILLLGPSGVGKTFLARAIHLAIFGDDEKFVAFNGSELSEKLVESELFGHEKGAFTGATDSKVGLLELANGGTLFIDEIATMPVTLQQKLLKALDEKVFYRVGDKKKVIQSKFRLITATCEDLSVRIREGHFREDLYQRICGICVDIPGLKDRREDIPLLIDEQLQHFGKSIIRPENVMKALMHYSWPGNIRELKKFVERKIATRDQVLRLSDVPLEVPRTKSSIGTGILSQEQIRFIQENGLPQFIESIEMEALKVFNDLYVKEDKKNTTVAVIKKLRIGNNRYYRISKKMGAIDE